MQTGGRENAPFVLSVAPPEGITDVVARSVLDASGTYTTPNPLGASGVPARGEAAADAIMYGIPDVLGTDRARYANKRVLVAGSGASAFNVLRDLATLTERAPQTHVIWLLRRDLTPHTYGGGGADQLPARGALGQGVRQLVDTGRLEVAANFKTTAVEQHGDHLLVHSDAAVLGPVDEIIVTTGFRSDLSLLGELRLGVDAAVESPTALAPLIDPNLHSCGTVRPHGVDELRHPEANFFIIGSKSYGRAPTFLLLTGYEQARSVVAALAGDWQAARDVQLVLPQTGVCSRPDTDTGTACCSSGVDASFVRVADVRPREARGTPIALVAVADRDVPAVCCTTDVQATCCAPQDKHACCGGPTSEASTCGCQ
jgi:hypothetical protein